MRRATGEEPQGFGAWLGAQMTRCGYDSNVELETVTGIGNTTISRWRNGTMAPSVDQLRKLERPLKTPLIELLVRAGVLSQDEAKVSREELDRATTATITSVAEAIKQDAELIEEARAHLLNQYDLLRRLSPSPSVARGKKAPRRAKTPSDTPLRAVARGGDPAHREQVSRMARRVREQQQNNGEGTEDST